MTDTTMPSPSLPSPIPSNAPRIVKAVGKLLAADYAKIPVRWVIGSWCGANCGTLPGILSCRELASEYPGGIGSITTHHLGRATPITDDVSRNWVACQVTMADSASAEFKCDCRLLADYGSGWEDVEV